MKRTTTTCIIAAACMAMALGGCGKKEAAHSYSASSKALEERIREENGEADGGQENSDNAPGLSAAAGAEQSDPAQGEQAQGDPAQEEQVQSSQTQIEGGIAEDLAEIYDNPGLSLDHGSDGMSVPDSGSGGTGTEEGTAGSGGEEGNAAEEADAGNAAANGEAAEEQEYFVYEQKRYAEMFAPADDAQDFMFAPDYMVARKTINACDAKCYREVFGFPKPTLSDLEKKVDASKGLSATYKTAVKSYVKDWLSLWPESDFSALYANLDTLKVEERTDRQIQTLGMGENVVACYRNGENTIYVREGLDPSDRSGNDYIVWSHELTHAATTYREKKDGNSYTVRTYSLGTPEETGIYYEEAVITNLVYRLREKSETPQERSIYYTVPCNYYRLIMDCIDYDGNDLMNHTVAYFADKMGTFMNDRPDAKEYAAYILQLIGLEHKQANAKYLTQKAKNFDPLREYVVDMYCRKYLKTGMSRQEAEKVFSNLTEQMGWNIDNLTVEYEEKDASVFRPEFEKCCKALGIEL